MEIPFESTPPTLGVRGMLYQMAELLLRYPDYEQRAATSLPTPNNFWFFVKPRERRTQKRL